MLEPVTGITPRSGGTIETTRSLVPPNGITRGTSGRSITDIPQGTPPSQTELDAIIQRSRDYTAGLPLCYFLGTCNPSAQSSINTNDASNINKPFYGSNNPFEILGDAFLRAFGGSSYNPPRQSERTVVESAGGSSNIGLLLIVGGVGFAVYWFFFRNK